MTYVCTSPIFHYIKLKTIKYEVYRSQYHEPDMLLGSFDTIPEAKKYMQIYLKENNYGEYSIWIEKERIPMHMVYFRSEKINEYFEKIPYKDFYY